MNVLANDGISKEGVDRLNSAGFKTIVESIDQSEIIDFINNNNIEVLLVRYPKSSYARPQAQHVCL